MPRITSERAGAAPSPEEPLPAPTGGIDPPAGERKDSLQGAPEPKRLELLFGDPAADARVHAALYASLPQAMEAGLAKLAERFPEVDRTFAARFLEVALSVGVQVPEMTFSHECGHLREARAQGAQAGVEMLGWMSGVTRYAYPEGREPTAAEEARVAAAGVNQEQLNALYMYESWAKRGSAGYAEAMGYLLAQTNLALYASMTSFYEARGVPISAANDVKAYLGAVEKRGKALTTGQLTALALGADLFSAPVWASLVGQVRVLAGGSKEVGMPALELGGVKATLPNTHLLLTEEGPVLGAQVLVDPTGKNPVQLSLDLRTDLRAGAVGAKLYDLPLAEGLTLNPYLRASLDRGRAGVMVGAEARLKLEGGAALTGTVEYRHDDLLAGAEGRADGVLARVGVSIPL